MSGGFARDRLAGIILIKLLWRHVEPDLVRNIYMDTVEIDVKILLFPFSFECSNTSLK